MFLGPGTKLQSGPYWQFDRKIDGSFVWEYFDGTHLLLGSGSKVPAAGFRSKYSKTTTLLATTLNKSIILKRVLHDIDKHVDVEK